MVHSDLILLNQIIFFSKCLKNSREGGGVTTDVGTYLYEWSLHWSQVIQTCQQATALIGSILQQILGWRARELHRMTTLLIITCIYLQTFTQKTVTCLYVEHQIHVYCVSNTMIYFVCYHIYIHIYIYKLYVCSVNIYKPVELVCCFEYSNFCCTRCSFQTFIYRRKESEN